MISIQRIHIYLNFQTYSYDRIFNDRFCPMKSINHLIYNCKFISTLFVPIRTSHTHESRYSKQGLNAFNDQQLVSFSCVV